LVLGLGVTVEVKIRHDVPIGFAGGQGAAQTKNFASKHPPDQTNRVTTLVVSRNGNINVFGRGIGVAQGNNGNVDVGCLFDGLRIGTGVGNNDESWFLE
jgi:hypothetical protein